VEDVFDGDGDARELAVTGFPVEERSSCSGTVGVDSD